MKILQKGFNYSQDGPGNRLVYHLQGCNFACKWCSNADSIPLNNPNAKEVSVSDLFNEILRSRMMFFDGGGVTFTGGEATLQSDELLELLVMLKKERINTCVETNGTSPRFDEFCELVDYLIVDMKHYDNELHIKWVGKPIDSVRKNIESAFSSGRQIHIRIPVINGVNVNPEAFVEYFSRFNTSNAVFEFLAYHEYGKDKWQGKYQIENGFVSDEIIRKFHTVFRGNGLETIST